MLAALNGLNFSRVIGGGVWGWNVCVRVRECKRRLRTEPLLNNV